MVVIVSSPRNGIYTVVFYYLVKGELYADHGMPRIEIPCKTYAQACAVADAYNKTH
jgi:hypothetical protein